MAQDGRRSLRRWVSDDLSKMNPPSSIVATLRQHPLLIVESVVVGAVLSGLLALVLLAFGNLDTFDDNVFFAWLGAALHVGQRIHGYRPEASPAAADDSTQAE